MAAVPAVMYGEGVEETLLGRFEIGIGLVDVILYHAISFLTNHPSTINTDDLVLFPFLLHF